MKLNHGIDSLLLASSILLSTTAQAGGPIISKAPAKAEPAPIVCGDIHHSKVYTYASDLFTDCPDQAARCLTLLQGQVDSTGKSLQTIHDTTTQATIRECLEKFEDDLFGGN